MAKNDAVVAVFSEHNGAEAAIRKLAAGGVDMKHFSIVGQGSVHQPVGADRRSHAARKKNAEPHAGNAETPFDLPGLHIRSRTTKNAKASGLPRSWHKVNTGAQDRRQLRDRSGQGSTTR